MFKEFINLYGMEIIAAILTGLFGLVGMMLKRIAQRYLDNSTKRAVARTAVRYVEQAWKDIHGEEKLKKALETASILLAEQGIDWRPNEMKILLEEAVEEMNEMLKPPLMDGIEVAEIATAASAE